MEDNADRGKDNHEDHSLHVLFEACASITKTALACRTLGSPRVLKQGHVAALCREERELAMWLERQILDYRVSIARLSSSTESSEKPSSSMAVGGKRARDNNESNNRGSSHDSNETHRKRICRLEGELLDESLRFQMSHCLLNRIQMAKVEQQAASVSTAAATTIENDDNSESSGIQQAKQGQQLILREALKSRDDHVCSALNKLHRLDEMDKELAKLEQQSQDLQNQNRNLWNQQVPLTDESSPSARLLNGENKDSIHETTMDKTSVLEKENLVLKRALADTIAGSDIDWYSNERIRNTMMKLEG